MFFLHICENKICYTGDIFANCMLFKVRGKISVVIDFQIYSVYICMATDNHDSSLCITYNSGSVGMHIAVVAFDLLMLSISHNDNRGTIYMIYNY